jgi:hypothetical protein
LGSIGMRWLGAVENNLLNAESRKRKNLFRWQASEGKTSK